MTDSITFAPDWVSPPGDTIADLLEERGWTHSELAERTGFTPKHVNALLKGAATISPDAAERLARVLGSTPDFWLVREAHYQAAIERRRAAKDLASEAEWLKEVPLAWMRRQGWVEAGSSASERVEACLRFFGVATVPAWRATYEAPLAAFRASPTFEKKLGAVAAWLRWGERKATDQRCAPYDRAAFKDALGDLRGLTNATDPGEFVPQLVARCARHGVAVVFAPAPPGCPASGATRWLAPDKAMLLLSLRYSTNDHLWFTFFHEAAHLLLHGKKLQFVEGLDELDEAAEAEADRFACDWLIPPAEARRLEALMTQQKGRFGAKAVTAFAGEIGIAPGIVVGRMQKEKWLPWSDLNQLKVRYAWGDFEAQQEA